MPQGSVLSPTLYTLYTADLPAAQGCTIATFADDTAIFSSNKNVRFVYRAMHRQLDLLTRWFDAWRIHVNGRKSTAVLFTRRRIQPVEDFSICRAFIQYHPGATYLGVYLDQTLTLKDHLTAIATKARRRIAALFPILRSASLHFSTRRHVYTQMIRPMMSYAAPAWLHAAKSYLHLLQIAQNRALRALTGHDRYTRTIQLHEDAELPYIIDHLTRLRLDFWNRTQASPHAPIVTLGTKLPSRRTYAMPSPP